MANLLISTVNKIHYKPGWKVKLHVSPANLTPQLFWEWDAMDPMTGRSEPCESRHWLIEYPLTEEGIVRTAFAAALAAEEHECREWFQYGSQRPFDPHKRLLE